MTYRGSSCGVVCAIACALACAVSARAETAPVPPESEPDPSPHVFSARLGVGLSSGGERPPDTTLDSGEGIALNAGAMVTPVWLSRFGFGATADFGYKYASAAGFRGYSLSRVPMSMAGHVLFAATDSMMVRGAFGPYLEVGVELTVTESRRDTDIRFPDALGWIAEGGLLYRVRSFAVDTSLRYTGLHYDAPANVDASHFGLFIGMHYVFF